MATNKEFYGDKLLALAIWSKNGCQLLHEIIYDKNCAEKKCVNCEFASAESVENWLNAEHVKPEPPLLENGDSLKPGDWIMVRDSETCYWDKLQFMCYYNNMFYCVENRKTMEEYSYLIASGWNQARLPMEGE